jgi:transaldolase
MSLTSIQRLNDFGQSVWFDNINRSLIDSGKLKKMIDVGLRGVTSNPTIFDKAISQDSRYDEKIIQLNKIGKTIFEIYDDLTVCDIQDAADIFVGIYEKTNKVDGYISLEVNPLLASKPRQTIEEAKRLYNKVNRPNVMFKIPSTEEGFLAIEELLASGINVNATLIFSVKQYKKTVEAFLRGLERLSKDVDDLSNIASVASIFVSRIDTAVDKIIEHRLSEQTIVSAKERLHYLKGKAAVSNSQLIFKEYVDIFSEDRFRRLRMRGARPQRVLWASTSTKNPAYSDIKYVTELIGKNTVNTLPEVTFDAFLDHGKVKEALPGDLDKARNIINDLKDFEIDIDNVCAVLLRQGVTAFVNSFKSVLRSIEEKAKSLYVK